MIATVKQVARIRDKDSKVTRLFVPPSVAGRWKVGRPVKLRRLTHNEETGRRQLTTVTGEDSSPVLLTPTALSPVQILTEITQQQALHAGFRTTEEFVEAYHECYGRETAVVEVVFVYGDIRDEPRLLSARLGRTDYTKIPALSAQGEPETVNDAWLAKFGTVADPFIVDTARERSSAAKVEHHRARRARQNEARATIPSGLGGTSGRGIPRDA